MHEFLLFLTLADATCSTVVTQVTLLRLLQDKDHPRVLIPELCRLFYQLGWVTGTGGGISLKQGFVCKFLIFFQLTMQSIVKYWKCWGLSSVAHLWRIFPVKITDWHTVNTNVFGNAEDAKKYFLLVDVCAWQWFRIRWG